MSRPGLSMWGKEGEPMTPQERAAALLERMGLCGHPAASQFVGDIIEHDQQTRQAALLEAVQQLREGARLAQSREVANALSGHAYTIDRLAQEG